MFGEGGAGSAPRPCLLHQFAERKELGDLFALSSVNQVARVGISSNLDFITIFSLAPGFTLKVKFGCGGEGSSCSELTPLSPSGGPSTQRKLILCS